MSELRGFKSITALALVFKKIESEDKTKFDIFYSNPKAEIIINESYIVDAFESIYTTIILNMQKSLRKGPNWIIDSFTDHNISILKYNHLPGSSYIKLPKELDHPRVGLLNIQNIDDNECFKNEYCQILKSTDHWVMVTKADEDFTKKLDFKGKIFSKN